MSDEPANLIYRALQGKPGKVEIGGRRYSFSCVPSFRLMDEQSGRVHECSDSATLLGLVLSLWQAGPNDS